MITLQWAVVYVITHWNYYSKLIWKPKMRYVVDSLPATQISSYHVDLLPLLRERLHLRFLLTADQRVCRKKIWEQVESIQLTPALGQGYCWTLKGQMIKRQEQEPGAIQVERKQGEEGGNMTMD